jgi:hypothetical protein
MARLVAVDWHGFIGIPAGTELKFLMTPQVLGFVDSEAPKWYADRAPICCWP